MNVSTGVVSLAILGAGISTFAEVPAEHPKKMSAEELLALDVQNVTTPSRKDEKETEAPATVMVITAKDIRLRGYSTLVDVMRDLPGMETIPYYFSEIGTQIPVRGVAGNNMIIVLVNGMRVNPPGGENMPFRSDFSVRNAERIEVVYGPGSTLYGQDANSAVINVITKTPGQEATGEVLFATGLNNEREAYGSFGGALDKNGHFKLSGYAQYHESDLTKLNEEYADWWKPFDALAEPRGDGTTPWRRDHGLNIFGRVDMFGESYVQAWYRSSYRSSSEGGHPPAYVDEARWEDASLSIEGHNAHRLSESVKLDSSATYSHYEIDPSTRYVFNTPGLTNAWFLNDYKYGIGESYKIDETLSIDISENLSFVGGGSASRYNIVPKSTIPGGADTGSNIDSQGGSFYYTVPGNSAVQEIPRVVRSEYEVYEGYGELGWKCADDWKLIAGARITDDSRFSERPFTPRAGVIYDITQDLAAKYIYSRAHVQPAPYFANAVFDNGALLATSNPNLNPEKMETHEVNVTYNTKNLSLGSSAYYGHQHDVIVMAQANGPENIVEPTVYLNGDSSQPRTLVHTANSGDSRSWGGSLYGRATVGSVSTWASYSYADFDEEIFGVSYDLAGASHHNVRAGSTWAVTPDLFITPAFVLRSTPSDVDGGVLDDELDTPWQLDLYALYNLSESVDFFVNVKNLTDNHYALGGLSGKAVPQETLNGEAGIRASF